MPSSAVFFTTSSPPLALTAARSATESTPVVSRTNADAANTPGTAFSSSGSVIRIGGNTAATSFTLGENVTVASDWCYGVTYFGTQPQTVVIDGTVAVTGAQGAVENVGAGFGGSHGGPCASGTKRGQGR